MFKLALRGVFLILVIVDEQWNGRGVVGWGQWLSCGLGLILVFTSNSVNLRHTETYRWPELETSARLLYTDVPQVLGHTRTLLFGNVRGNAKKEKL
jgi:hypothetical protein